MRIQYKGGVWKNSEDEILKAAVMKYGMNQWARIASLMVHKSAKQCKARWFEWLDPSIKKTAWTREEEERLLHLAKIMPTQWRTIAPMIGRTATQCLEHYEKLLDQAQLGGTDGSGTSGIGAAKARDADTIAPESKPARPDAVDMDEEELEMLGEARARLANTKGKKAKRKAREKQLEAAKRIAHLQKRRELKAAGINMKLRRKDRKQADLAVEIPHFREPAPGFYNTFEERKQAASLNTDVRHIGRKVLAAERQNKAVEEARNRRQDEQRRKKFEERNPEAALFGKFGTGTQNDINDNRDGLPVLHGKKGLSLPKPQVSDAELEAIAKAGNLFADKIQGAKSARGEENNITGGLVPDKNPILATPSSIAGDTDVASGISTPGSTGTWAEERQRHLQTIQNLHNTDTPLMGGTNTPMIGTPIIIDPASTPGRRTPNPLGTSTPLLSSDAGSTRSGKKEWRRQQKLKAQLMKKRVQDQLDKLSEPDNEYTFDVDNIVDDIEEEDDNDEKMDIVEDAEEEIERLKREGIRALRKAKRLALSSAARKNLPIPDKNWILSEEFRRRKDAAGKLQGIVLRDINVQKILLEGGAGGDEREMAKKIEQLGTASLKHARAMIRAEAEKGAETSMDDIVKILEDRDAKAIAAYVEAEKQKKIAVANIKKSGAEKKMDLLTKGFDLRLEKAQNACREAFEKANELDTHIECVLKLEEGEKREMERRIKEWEEKLADQKKLAAELQTKYANVSTT